MSKSHQAGKHKLVPVEPLGRPGNHRLPKRRRSRAVPALLSLAGAAVAGTLVATGLHSPAPSPSGAVDEGSNTRSPLPTEIAASTPPQPRPVQVTPEPSVQPTAEPTVRTRKPKPASEVSIPEVGSGELVAAGGTGHLVGSGPLTTYTVEVERDVPINPEAVARLVDATLSDPRSWTANGSHSLQRVESGGDLRVVVTTPETTDQLCAPLDTGGRLSCRSGEYIVLNAWRWVNGAPAYEQALTDYRRYLINHEVGHGLGNPHEACHSEGALAPVMMQQTKGVGDCQPNPWPYPD